MNRRTDMRRVSIALVAIVLLSIVTTGCRDGDSPRGAVATPSFRGDPRTGFDQVRKKGVVVSTDAEAQQVLGFVPAQVDMPSTSKLRGRVALPHRTGPNHHWLIAYYDDDALEFQQQMFPPGQDNERGMDAFYLSENQGLIPEDQPNRRVVVRGHNGWAWDKRSGYVAETTDGNSLEMNIDHAGVVWVDGDMLYALLSSGELDSDDLLKIARTYRR